MSSDTDETIRCALEAISDCCSSPQEAETSSRESIDKALAVVVGTCKNLLKLHVKGKLSDGTMRDQMHRLACYLLLYLQPRVTIHIFCPASMTKRSFPGISRTQPVGPLLRHALRLYDESAHHHVYRFRGRVLPHLEETPATWDVLLAPEETSCELVLDACA